MVRQLIAGMLMLVLPLPGLAVPHCHGAPGEPRDHHRAHVHLGSTHHHSHGHRHSHHHHKPDAGKAEAPEKPGSSHNHDDDAVYVASDLAVAGSGASEFEPGRETTTIAWLAGATSPVAGHTFAVHATARPPSSDGIPLYLATLSLRL